jgi:ABC-type Fe3+-siderophore transport system, permease component
MLIAALGLSCAAAVIVFCGIGKIGFSAKEVLEGLFTDKNETARLIVRDFRLVRIIVAGIVGASLALCGAILQCVMHNSLASPSTIGVTSGASLAGHIMLVAFPGIAYLVPVGAVLGALITTLFILSIAYRGKAAEIRIILVGLAISALFGAANDAIRTFFSARLGNVSGFIVGNLSGVGLRELYILLPAAAVVILLCLTIPAKLNVLSLGEEESLSLGLNTGALRILLIICTSLISGLAVAVAGLIGFVGLIVPHAVKLAVGSDYRYILPASCFAGFLLMVVSDGIGRVILPAGELPVGIILALIGAPFFLYLVVAKKKEA